MKAKTDKRSQRESLNQSIKEYLDQGGKIKKIDSSEFEVNQNSSSKYTDPDDFPDFDSTESGPLIPQERWMQKQIP